MKNIKSDTIARTVWLLLALINQILATAGRDVLPFTQDEIYQLFSLLFTIATSAVAWWKNNSFTNAAILGDLYKDSVKEVERTEGNENWN
ncbi:MAG: phage holin [Clostridia bacterium]|nr:phage holin [Clostridia bacterium]